jgi:hypothetical protein
MTPLYAPLAMRTSDVLGDFTESFFLKHRYGDLTKSPFRLNKTADREYFVADHPMTLLNSVQISGQSTDAWEYFTRTDPTGVTNSYIRLGSDPDRIDSIVTATGLGKASRKTGNLIENPADIVQDIARINGKELDFPLFREQCNGRNIRFAGSLEDNKSLILYIKSLLESTGALWVYNNVVFFPDVLPYGKVLNSYTSPSYKLELEQRAGSIKLAFNYNDGSQRYGSFVVVRAVGSLYTNQREVFCKWLRGNKAAIELANRLAGYYAGEWATVSSEVEGLRHSGEVVSLSSPLFTGEVLITESTPGDASSKITGRQILSTWPKLSLDSYTAELPITQTQAIELDFTNGVLTITIYDTDNKPFVGATVALDDGTPKKTNNKGRVQFKTVAGGHALDISAPGFQSITNLPITVK